MMLWLPSCNQTPYMAQNTTTNATDDVKPTVLHDFLGRSCAPAATFAAATDVAGCSSASASAAAGLGSERQVGTLYEGVPLFGQKTDALGPMVRYSGSKRRNGDSGVTPPETSHLMKTLRNVGAERSRWPHDDQPFMGVHQMRATSSSSSSHMAQLANGSKLERAIPVNVRPVLQYSPHGGQGVPNGYQPVANIFKDFNTGGSPLISHLAADEGSRTGIKGSGVLSSVNVSGSVPEPSSSKLKSLISNNEPNTSTPRHQGSTFVSRQMTVFYGDQAHVFDDVHPNKADMIMALAGSNGGSWSTSFLANSSLKPPGGEDVPLSGGQDNISIKAARGQMQAGAE